VGATLAVTVVRTTDGSGYTGLTSSGGLLGYLTAVSAELTEGNEPVIQLIGSAVGDKR